MKIRSSNPIITRITPLAYYKRRGPNDKSIGECVTGSSCTASRSAVNNTLVDVSADFRETATRSSRMHTHHLATILAITLTSALIAAPPLPSTADGKPNFAGIWQAYGSSAAADLQDHAARFNRPAGVSVVAGGEIPYQPWAAAKK